MAGVLLLPNEAYLALVSVDVDQLRLKNNQVGDAGGRPPSC
jgi:hypothetical protein